MVEVFFYDLKYVLFVGYFYMDKLVWVDIVGG